MILVSPAEPPEFASLGPSQRFVEDEYGADFLIVGAGYTVAVQRKTFPADFLASVADGRFAVLLPRMLAADVRILLLEGQPRWTADGALVNDLYSMRDREFRRSHLRSILWSLQWVWGVGSHWTDGIADSLDFLRDLRRWADKDRHDALGVRPGPERPFGRTPSPRERAVHFLQGIDGLGPELAGRVYDEFGGVPMTLSVDREDLLRVPGLGPKRVERILGVVGEKPAAERPLESTP